MGNETSSEYQQAYGIKPSRGVERSSSLRSNRPTAYQTGVTPVNERKNLSSSNDNKGAVESNIRVKKKGVLLKRSNTFTAISTFTRPLFQSSPLVKSSRDDNDTNGVRNETTKKNLWRNKWRSFNSTSSTSSSVATTTKKDINDTSNIISHKKPNKRFLKTSSRFYQLQHTAKLLPSTLNEWDESSSVTDDNDGCSINTREDDTSSTTTSATTDQWAIDNTPVKKEEIQKIASTSDSGVLFVPRKPSLRQTKETILEIEMENSNTQKNTTKMTEYQEANDVVETTTIKLDDTISFEGYSASNQQQLTLDKTINDSSSSDNVNVILQEKSSEHLKRQINQNTITAFHSDFADDNCSNDGKLANTDSFDGDQTEKRSDTDIDSHDIETDMERTTDVQENQGNSSEGEEEGRKYSTPAEKRRKNVLRSRSMNYHMNRPKLTVEHRSNSIDDKINEIDSTDGDRNSLTSKTPSLGGRRSSDSSLLKEQYVKQAEQFTILLKQFRQQRENRLKLTGNALAVITENKIKEETESVRFKARRKNDYIDSWLKDQSQRIDVLADAVKGDPEKVRRLRASFRERSLKCPQKDLLPQRPSSTRPPRRKNNNFVALISSSDSDEDHMNIRKSNNGCCYLLDKNGNMITKEQQSTLKKQLSDTLILVDNSFKKIKNKDLDPLKRQLVDKERRLPPLATNGKNGNGTNVAIVKPMQRTPVNACAEESENNNNNTSSTAYNQTVKKTDFVKPIVIEETTATYQEEEKQQIAKEFSNANQFFDTKTNLPSSSSCGNIQDELHLKRTPKKLSEGSITLLDGERSDVDRISKSLDQVMGDLKTLRDQDIDLAKQLLGLGKSIKDFKKEQKGRCDIMLERRDAEAAISDS